MRFWKRLQHRLFALTGKQRLDAEMDAELSLHIEMQTRENIEAGMHPDEARRAALRQFGGVESVKETCRDQRGVSPFENLAQDICHGARMLRKNPGFAAVAVLTLALGIGANTAIFSVIDSVLIESLPYTHPEQIVQIFESIPNGGRNSVSGGAFIDWQQLSTRFAHLAIYENTELNLTSAGEPERVSGLKVSSDFLPVLGISPIVGRGFAPGDDRAGGNNRSVVLAHSFWQSRYGADPGVIGKVISLDQMPYTIIGVLPPQALIQNTAMFLMPEIINAPAENWGRSGHFRDVIGRLQPGATLEQAQAELRSIKLRLNTQYPQFKQDWSVSIIPMQEVYAGTARPMLLVLLGTVALVLLIACANVSNLLLARSSARSREMAIRAALGANSWRIMRQLLVESFLLAASGCLAGLLLAWLGIRLLTHMVTGFLPEILQPNLNLNVLGFSILAACGGALLFGAFPAWRASQLELNRDLKDSERGGISASKKRSQSFLVVSEFTFTLILLIGAGLFLRSFVQLLHKDPGFNPRQTLAFDLSFPAAKYPKTEDRLRFIKDLNSRLAALPGVESSGTANSLPLGGGGLTEMASRADKPPRTDYIVSCNYVGGDYFSALRIKLLRGRLITDADNRPGSLPAVVIDTCIARDLYPGEDPIGHSLNLLGNNWEIVGIAQPIQQFAMDTAPRPTLYAAQAFSVPSTSVAIRSTLPLGTLIQSVRKTILEADPDQPIANIRTLEQAIHKSLATRQTTLILVGLFAGLAISLACVGIYGVMAHAIGQRAREFCVRSALGAQRQDIIRLVLAGGMKPSAAGIGVGLIAALALTRLLESQLFEVRARDPLVFAGAVCLLALVAAVAVLIPARRAANMDPMKALRNE